MYRIESRATQRIIDLGVLSIAFWSAFLLRFDGDIPLQFLKRALFLWPYVVVLQYVALALFRVPSFSWRYVGLRDVSRILLALTASSAVLLVTRIITGTFFNLASPAGYLFIPFGVILIDYLLVFLGIAGVRALRRLLVERFESGPKRHRREFTPTLLIGAGRAGLMVAHEIERRAELGLHVVGFVDDDVEKRGLSIHGIRVLGTTVELPSILAEEPAEQAIITIANASGKAIRKIQERCKGVGLPAKIIPGIYEIIDGKVNLERIREVSIEDLLRREVVELGAGRVDEFLRRRCLVVTGAGGSIGAEIARQVARRAPSRIVLIERAEPALFEIHRALGDTFPNVPLVPLLADVCDAEYIARVFAELRPEVVFHAAAHKHVPMSEWNPGEALKNNVMGTKIVADAAHACGAGAFVLISTDKAVNPTSIMGATKRVAELYVQALAQTSATKFVAVRFGNVLGSTGSVVPIFKDQIARGGPVTVTHPEMKRYFMTIPEATALVLQAASIGQDSEILVLDMGEPVRILDLAIDLIKLSGFEPYEEIPIELTGVRPGEKLFEELGFDSKSMRHTQHPKIFVLTQPPPAFAALDAAVASLIPHLRTRDSARVRGLLLPLVPELQGSAESAPADATADDGEPSAVAATADGLLQAG